MKSDEIQIPRLYELVLLKALAIVSRILCHCAVRRGQHWPGFEQDVRCLIGDIVFGTIWPRPTPSCSPWASRSAAQRRTAPAGFSPGRPALRAWLRPQLLSIRDLRAGRRAPFGYVPDTGYALIVQDILHFAGLALMATGLFKRLRLKEVHILLIGILLSALGRPLAFICQGSPAADYFLGHFLVTTEENFCFAFFNWYVFTAFGMWFGAAPLLVFGNSSGDLSMAQYALQHGGRSCMLLCDDTERDYGDLETASSFAETCRSLGLETVSVRDEFQTIYKTDTVKTALQSKQAA